MVHYNPFCINQLFIQRYERLDLLELNVNDVYITSDFNISIFTQHRFGNATALHQFHRVFNLAVLATPLTRITGNTASTISQVIDCPQSILKSLANNKHTLGS